ncbi:MAG: outer membrane beta-barrel protein [Flavobacteriales bacterium]|nr:outer membrane beta-barrel protein [Flavobacteriales bacterium]
MKRLTLLFVSFTLLTLTSQAQYSMDFGFSLGGSNYVGEVGGRGDAPKPWLLDMNLAKTNIGLGGFYRYNFTRNIAAKISVNYARIGGSDSTSKIKTQIARNLSFRTDIIELALTGEYYFFTINNLSRASNARIDFGAYAFAGAGIALYYPYAQYQDKWYYLRPLQTEGVENAYDEMTVVIPFGAGANFTFNKKIKLGIEFGYRFTFTDYLDDISTDYAFDSELPFEESILFANRTDEAYARGENGLPSREAFRSGSIRGNPDTNDGYLLGLISISYNISNKNSFHKARYNSVINRRRKRTKF